MFPVWQVCQDKEVSNGSTYHKRLKYHLAEWWMDMHIDVQLRCELALSQSRSTFQVRYKHTDYLIDIEGMTQLNLQSGTIRRIRRRVLSQIP